MKKSIMLVLGVPVLFLLYSESWAVVPKSGLVAEYLFDGNTNDSSGNSKDGQAQGASLSSDRWNRANNAYSLDGISNYIDLGTWFNLQSFTISLWVKPRASQLQYADIIDNNHTGSRSFVLQQDSTNTNSYYAGFSDGANAGIPIKPIANKWSHIVIIRDGSTKIATGYLNGSLLGSVTGNSDNYYDGSEFLRLGRWGGGGRFWNGLVDDVRIYDRALSESEVKDLNHEAIPAISAFTVIPNAGSAPLAADFTCRATSPNGTLQYLWDVNGDGATDTNTATGKLSYVYDAVGIYNASVTVLDKSGYHVQSSNIKVTVANGPELSGKVENYQFDDATNTINTKFRIINTGNVAAPPFNVGFSVSDNGIGSKVFKTISVSGLAAGQSTPIIANYTFPDSIYGRQISVAIDSGKKVAEVDETNNDTKIVISPVLK